jgi:hypothetical protein
LPPKTLAPERDPEEYHHEDELRPEELDPERTIDAANATPGVGMPRWADLNSQPFQALQASASSSTEPPPR